MDGFDAKLDRVREQQHSDMMLILGRDNDP
jgi:hypothetical protein